eukprot:TRINITY_DN3136_c0_g1_i1.p1 TRINITY_DN3136_c0_g1~~TRINITY_DN3136_c0_g1_i1.p1  ORF type:complete len:595 (+),score=118.26 TRINITY_DN3136_c0_g1_i1:130-1785(+)
MPSLRSELGQQVLATYRATMKEKKRQQVVEAPMLNFEVVATTRTKGNQLNAREQYEEVLELIQKGDLEVATAVLLETIRNCGPSIELYSTAADLYKMRKLPEEALSYYNLTLEMAPAAATENSWDFIRLFKERGECYSMLTAEDPSATKKAAAEYDKYFLISDPTFDELLIAGKMHLDSRQLERADELFRQAHDKNSNDPYLHFNMGELAELRNDLKESKFHFSKTIEIDPDFVNPYIKHAEDLLLTNGPEDVLAALSCYLSVLKLLPRDGAMHIRIADIYDMLGAEYSGTSKVMLSRALELALEDSAMAQAYVRRGIISQTENLLSEAISDFTMALCIEPRNQTALLNRAEASLLRSEEGDVHTAAQDYQTLTSIEGIEKEVVAGPWLWLAEYYFSQRFGEATSVEVSEFCVDGSTKDIETYKKQLSLASSSFNQAILSGGQGNITQEIQQKIYLATSVTNNYCYELLDTDEVPPSVAGLAEEIATSVPPLTFTFLEQYFLKNKALEPTVHNQLFNEFQFGWRSIRGFASFSELLDRHRNDPAKGKKKKK